MKAHVLALLAVLAAGCSNASEPPPEGRPTQDTSPTTPAPAEGAADDEPAPPAPLVAAPGCGKPGARVLLRLGVTRDGRAPACFRVEDFAVRFGAKPARVWQIGPTDEGYCALDVLVPEEAESGTVVVQAGRDAFESPSPFRVPCN